MSKTLCEVYSRTQQPIANVRETTCVSAAENPLPVFSQARNFECVQSLRLLRCAASPNMTGTPTRLARPMARGAACCLRPECTQGRHSQLCRSTWRAAAVPG